MGVLIHITTFKKYQKRFVSSLVSSTGEPVVPPGCLLESHLLSSIVFYNRCCNRSAHHKLFLLLEQGGVDILLFMKVKNPCSLSSKSATIIMIIILC